MTVSSILKFCILLHCKNCILHQFVVSIIYLLNLHLNFILEWTTAKSRTINSKDVCSEVSLQILQYKKKLANEVDVKTEKNSKSF